MNLCFDMNLPFFKQSLIIDSSDILKFMRDPLKSLFKNVDIRRIEHEKNDVVSLFFTEFENLSSAEKFKYFVEVSIDVSPWIRLVLESEDNGRSTVASFNRQIRVISEQQDFIITHLDMDCRVLDDFKRHGLISTDDRISLENKILDGEFVVKWKLLSIIPKRNLDFLAIFLFLCTRHCVFYIEVFHRNLTSLFEYETAEENLLSVAKVYVSSLLHVDQDDSDSIVAQVESIYDAAYSRNFDVRDESLSERAPPSLHNDFLSDITEQSFSGDPENPDFDELFGKVKDIPVGEMLNLSPNSAKDKELRLREYQDELTQHGLTGENVLICAPTGSGKTIVAIKIVQEHLKQREEGACSSLIDDRRVAFIVPTAALVDQQYTVLSRYLSDNCRVTQLKGTSSSRNTDLTAAFEFNQVVVMTPAILLNALDNKERSLSLGRLSLIVLDEAHHCDKGHSYNKVMEAYFSATCRLQDSAATVQLPQIVGMTASTGTDKAASMETALRSLINLCANLDCRRVVTVRDHLDQLQELVPQAQSEVKLTAEREEDYYENDLLSLMDNIEEHLTQVFANHNRQSAISIPSDKFEDRYLNFIGNLLNIKDLSRNEALLKSVTIIKKYLECCYRALIVNHLFESTHSIKMVADLSEASKTVTKGDPDETRMINLIKDFLQSARSDAQSSNPSLEFVLQEVTAQMEQQSDSRVVVFVKEVVYATLLKERLQQLKNPLVKAEVLVGQNKTGDKGGLTRTDTDSTVHRFRRGTLTVLLCTSVAEEGLDIQQCNLVIRYGHVTNETALVQSRGRARAVGSRYLVVVPNRMNWQVRKEAVNQKRESMMYEAIKQFQNKSDAEIKDEIGALQGTRGRLSQGNSAISSAPATCGSAGSSSGGHSYRVFCKHRVCHLFNSEDVRIANTTSYIVVNPVRFENLIFKPEDKNSNNCPILCGKCRNRVGQRIRVQNGPYAPLITLNNFLVELPDQTKKAFKSWKDVPFKPTTVNRKDLSAIGDVYLP